MDVGSAFLQLDTVSKRYGAVDVLHDVSFSVARNEFLTILGPSGSGKTTILRLIAGFEQATGGAIRLDGTGIDAMPINRRPFNTVFQDYALFPHLSVRRNVAYGLMVRGIEKAKIDARVAEVLSVVGLDAFATRLPHELSGGQRQRVALARAIICEPRLILLDEPLAALDVTLRAQMCAFLKSIQRRMEIAFVFITHDQQEAIAMSDRIIVMNKGRIEQVGTPEDLYLRPRTRFVAGFFGENNLVEGLVTGLSRGCATVETGIGTLDVQTDAQYLTSGDQVRIAIRPENIVLSKGEKDGRAFTVRDVQFAGASVIVDVVDAVSGRVEMRVRQTPADARRRPAIGDAVALSWSAQDVTLIADGPSDV